MGPFTLDVFDAGLIDNAVGNVNLNHVLSIMKRLYIHAEKSKILKISIYQKSFSKAVFILILIEMQNSCLRMKNDILLLIFDLSEFLTYHTLIIQMKNIMWSKKRLTDLFSKKISPVRCEQFLELEEKFKNTLRLILSWMSMECFCTRMMRVL